MKKSKNISLIVLGTMLVISTMGFAQRERGNSAGKNQQRNKGGKNDNRGHHNSPVSTNHYQQTHPQQKQYNHNNHVTHNQNYRPNHNPYRSHYRPANLTVYNPYWCPKRQYNRRWVYFPRYNFYWDNWRQVYVYRNANVWITNPTPPPTVVNITIENEKNYELNENEDDIDDVYKSNQNHTSEYKVE